MPVAVGVGEGVPMPLVVAVPVVEVVSEPLFPPADSVGVVA